MVVSVPGVHPEAACCGQVVFDTDIETISSSFKQFKDWKAGLASASSLTNESVSQGWNVFWGRLLYWRKTCGSSTSVADRNENNVFHAAADHLMASAASISNPRHQMRVHLFEMSPIPEVSQRFSTIPNHGSPLWCPLLLCVLEALHGNVTCSAIKFYPDSVHLWTAACRWIISGPHFTGNHHFTPFYWRCGRVCEHPRALLMVDDTRWHARCGVSAETVVAWQLLISVRPSLIHTSSSPIHSPDRRSVSTSSCQQTAIRSLANEPHPGWNLIRQLHQTKTSPERLFVSVQVGPATSPTDHREGAETIWKCGEVPFASGDDVSGHGSTFPRVKWTLSENSQMQACASLTQKATRVAPCCFCWHDVSDFGG